jgi:hypothetical protein
LAERNCQQILDDFHDEHGRSLTTTLENLHVDLSAYLRLLVFLDESTELRCAESNVLAVTARRSRVVRVCGANLDRELHYNERWATATFIHEALHTLGLGENPPSSKSITDGILKRCGR